MYIEVICNLFRLIVYSCVYLFLLDRDYLEQIDKDYLSEQQNKDLLNESDDTFDNTDSDPDG